MITLQYPGYKVTPTATIELPPPEFDDDLVNEKQVITYRTKNNKFKTVTVKSDREKYSTTLSFVLSCDQKNEFRDFCLEAQNHYILYVDYDLVQWICQISQDSFVATKIPSSYDVSINLIRWRV